MSATRWWRAIGPHWAIWAATITLSCVAVLVASSYAPGDWRRWPAFTLAVLIVVVQRFEPEHRYGAAGSFVHIAAMLGLTVALVALDANVTGIIIIGMVLSAHAVFAMPGRQGFAWIALFILLLFLYLTPLYQDRVTGLFNTLGMAAGFLFIGSAAWAQKHAEAADAESRRLLAQLQVANEQLRDHASRAEALAVAQERNRVAREVHDTLGHRLTVAAVQLEGAQKLIARDPEKAARMVETVRGQVTEGLAELRATVSMLRTPLESALTLPNAITRLASDFQSATGITTHVDQPASLPAVGDEQRHALLRAAQEALTNVQRHAHARTVWLALRCTRNGDGDALELTVQDDGVGLGARQPASSGGYGLRGLRERADQLDGRFVAGERPGGGAAISFCIPTSTSAIPAAEPATQART